MSRDQSVKYLDIQDQIRLIESKINKQTCLVCKNRLEQELFELERELEDIENEADLWR